MLEKEARLTLRLHCPLLTSPLLYTCWGHLHPGLRGRNLEVQSTPASIYKSNPSHVAARQTDQSRVTLLRHRAETWAREDQKGSLPWGQQCGASHSPQTLPFPSHPLSPLCPRGPGRSIPSQARFLQILFNRQSSNLEMLYRTVHEPLPPPTKHSLPPAPREAEDEGKHPSLPR